VCRAAYEFSRMFYAGNRVSEKNSSRKLGEQEPSPARHIPSL
jgi:hypothetical protein